MELPSRTAKDGVYLLIRKYLDLETMSIIGTIRPNNSSETPTELRSLALKARGHAAQFTDDAAGSRMLALAVELEARATALEAASQPV